MLHKFQLELCPTSISAACIYISFRTSKRKVYSLSGITSAASPIGPFLFNELERSAFLVTPNR